MLNNHYTVYYQNNVKTNFKQIDLGNSKRYVLQKEIWYMKGRKR